jgi:hypothetical protein
MSREVRLTGREPLVGRIAAAVGYTGRKFRLVAGTEVRISGLDREWSGGSHAEWTAVSFPGFEAVACDAPQAWPSPPVDHVVLLEPGKGVLVRHGMSCGVDTGLEIHIHPEGLAPLLPAAVELSSDEKAVLFFTRSLKPSHNGIRNYRQHSSGLDPGRWEAAKALCVAKGLLNKAGAITVAGRNACPDRWPEEMDG